MDTGWPPKERQWPGLPVHAHGPRREPHPRKPDLTDTIGRLLAYEAAGAQVLYAPGLWRTDEIAAVCEAVSAPVNVLAGPRLSVAEIGAAGASRISLGGSLAFVAYAAAARAAKEITDGDLSSLDVGMNVYDLLGAA